MEAPTDISTNRISASIRAWLGQEFDVFANVNMGIPSVCYISMHEQLDPRPVRIRTALTRCDLTRNHLKKQTTKHL